MHYVEAIASDEPMYPISLFMAGGITCCRNWQSDLVSRVRESGLKVTVYNPRRMDYPEDDPDAARRQIEWEFQRLRTSTMVSFWFCRETLCPITLFELGSALERGADVVIGVEPGYARKLDVEIQVSLVLPEIKIITGFNEFLEAVVRKLDLHKRNTVGNRKPVSDFRQPTTDNRQPTTDNRLLTTDNR